MDLGDDSGALSTHTTVEGQAGAQDLSLSSTQCETESGGTILLQLLEFKTHLLEAVEELHIRRDAEARFEDQLSKLMLEKQTLEWEKESLQHQIETVAYQNKDSLTNVKKEFQAKIRSIEEEKWKYKLTAELKDKEFNNLKEELKLLQLLKYNMEKKSSELEQKLALQIRSKDSHLNQLGEVEKRFTALSRQCAMVKQALEKLEQNVNEAMSINGKLSSINEKQVVTIVSLKKELEEVKKQLIKSRMTAITHDKTHSSTGKEQRIQQMHQKLNMETENNKKLLEKNETLRAEKQEVLNSLQHAQHLLLSQTQTLSRVELELQTQREQHQALKQEHEMIREKSKVLEDKMAQLMESYAVSKTSKKVEMTDSSQVLSVSTQVFPTSVEEVRAEKSLNELSPNSELCMFGSLKHMAFSLTKNPDCLEDTGSVTNLVAKTPECLKDTGSVTNIVAKNPDCLDTGSVTNLVATGATEGEEALNHHQQSQYKQPVNHSNPFMCPLITNNLLSLISHSGTDTCTNILNEYTFNSNRDGSNPDAVANSMNASSDNNLQISQISSVSGTMTVLSPDHRIVYGSANSVSKVKYEKWNTGINEQKHRGQDDWIQENRGKEHHTNAEQQWNREEVLRGDVKGGGSAGEKRGMLMTQTTDTDRQEDSKGPAEDAGYTRNHENEIRDRVEGESINGVKERGKTAVLTSETQIWDQTRADTTIEKSNQQQVVDFIDTEPPLAFSEDSECSQIIPLKVMDSDFIHPNKGWVILREEQLLSKLNLVDTPSVNCGLNPVPQEVQNCCCSEIQTQDAEPLNKLPNCIHQVPEKTTADKKPSDKSAAYFTTELSEPLHQSDIYCTQTDAAPLATKTDVSVTIKEVQTSTAPTSPMDLFDMKSNMKQTDDKCDTNVTEAFLSVRTSVELKSLSISQKISEQENGQQEALVTDDDNDGNSIAYKKSEGQPNVDRHEKRICQTVQEPIENSNLEDTCVSSSCQNHMESGQHTSDAKATKSETEWKLHRNEESTEVGCSKYYEQPSAKQMLLHNTSESFLHNKICRSSFNWGRTQRKAEISRTQSDVSVLTQLFEGSDQNTSSSDGNLRHSSSTIPMFLKNKPNKVPLVITRASELLNASSVSGTTASLRRHPLGEWKAIGVTCSESTAANTENRTSLSVSPFPSSTSSSTVSRLSWQAAPGSTKAPTSAAGFISEFDWETSCSEEREDEQLSFRAQISKIEQFLNKDRLGLSKRRRTES